MPTTTNVHTERVFEEELCAKLEASGWAIKTHLKNAPSYDRELAIYAADLVALVQRPSRPSGPSSNAGTTAKQLDTHGTLHALRHGFKDVDAKFFLCAFKPAHGKNPKLPARAKSRSQKALSSPTKLDGCALEFALANLPAWKEYPAR